MHKYSLPILGLAALLVFGAASANPAIPTAVTAAVADNARPVEDRARDPDRKPAEVLALAGVKAGDRVVDVGPGSGYYTRMLSRIVGTGGKVYAFNPTWVDEMYPKAKDDIAALIASGYSNVEGSIQPMADIKFEAPVDMIFISQLYHDEHWKQVDIAKMNKAVFAALKPGGVYFVVDHIAPPNTTDSQIDHLHRIDPAVVKREVLAAGFKLEAVSGVLHNPHDPLTVPVFDPSIRGKTSQFVYKFRKPLKK